MASKPVTPRKRPLGGEALAAEATAIPVTPDAVESSLLPSKKRRGATTDPDFNAAMSIFRSGMPGLGHNGLGLYGTLTKGSALKVLDRLDLEGKTHVDVGAADGRMLLGALALGAARSYGIEIAGDCLAVKFDGMKKKLEAKLKRPLSATLKCDTDICHLPQQAGVAGWLTHLFDDDAESDVVLTAIWHGFTIDSKETLLRAVAAAYPRVSRFSLIGPMQKDFGKPEDVLDFLRTDCHLHASKVVLAHHDEVTLSGGEAHRALTFHLLP
mmetsp:Transcript_9777/g.29638  ORF Transcript_9777/g.29638 Transcript_9777/m.29638 type:complete len:269 (-) Transcript_9777:378-1184(-)|eukprot:CAMPEP_0198670642 /NCGR_PEP_ID=MMETSP1467-20131203/82070_1 /TAXON_ID=1462469 /ORGANISM="unid. sp., Strain CCMP2135" /LENGTH=268 /DNA_ID=CAMNT_0044407425 /DNA_START=84 /DNA_END=890 /DNA_ORIENTATION=+